MATSWCLVVPVKPVSAAKSRLAPVAGPRRDELALAFVKDTVTAAVACPDVSEVIVVTDDPRVSRAVKRLGALVVPDEPGSGLNPALEFGAAVVAARGQRWNVAALSADLPALRVDELAAALRIAARHARSFAPDTSGAGTTLLAAIEGQPLLAAFGPDSAAAHRASGAYEITAAGLDSLRQDVDTEQDLRAALALGLGVHTARIAEALLGSG